MMLPMRLNLRDGVSSSGRSMTMVVSIIANQSLDAATEEDAMGANADPADLGMGCIGSPWVELRLNMDLDGDFVDNNGQPHTINAFLWVMGTAPSLFHIAEYSNDDDYALAQNDAANAYNSGLYSNSNGPQMPMEHGFTANLHTMPPLWKMPKMHPQTRLTWKVVAEDLVGLK